jgi:uncharacterized damage-inducible protein DinB
MNRKMLTRINDLPDREKCIRFFSHLINSQNKWMARILQYPQDPKLDWWQPVFLYDTLEDEWVKSLQMWIDFIEQKTEIELFAEAYFIGYNGRKWSASLKDIALQLNYHSIHHRAQMQLFIRQQGLEPDFIDYIGTVYKRISERK